MGLSCFVWGAPHHRIRGSDANGPTEWTIRVKMGDLLVSKGRYRRDLADSCQAETMFSTVISDQHDRLCQQCVEKYQPMTHIATGVRASLGSPRKARFGSTATELDVRRLNMLTDNRSRVLVVDDEKIISEVIVRWLTEVGYDCAMALDAADALALMAYTDFHLILLDIMMPGESGLELLPELKKQHPDTMVIMVTGIANLDLAVRAMRQGAFDYLVKPFDLVDLTIRAGRALRLQASTFAGQGAPAGLRDEVPLVHAR